MTDERQFAMRFRRFEKILIEVIVTEALDSSVRVRHWLTLLLHVTKMGIRKLFRIRLS